MSPRTPQQFKEMREEKMSRIMEVALAHFANDGYFRTSIRDIARHAGISKGLMYNYFESKEALLRAIVHKSVNEIYQNLDLNSDGYLSNEEFENFIRKLNEMLREKKYFWRLLFHLLAQHDVREKFLNAFPETDSLVHPGQEPGDTNYPWQIIKMITDYFNRKSRVMGEKFETETEVNMFLITMTGFAVQRIYSDADDNEKTINRIIALFK
jgi:AcrR family transcriptional regulator